jgi:pyrroloquinoline quinone biosynthesis protein B
MTLFVRVLGSGAGGGVPQWNSNSEACFLARAGDSRSPRRTQTSVAVSTDGASWWLLDASPDLGEQMRATRELWPSEGLRDSPIRGVVLTGGDVDKIAGLLALREGHRLLLHATSVVLAQLAANPIFGVLDARLVGRRRLVLGEPTKLGPGAAPVVRAFFVPGKVPRWQENARDPLGGALPEHTIGLLVSDGASREYLAYVPGCLEIDDRLIDQLQAAEVVLFDGTLWQDDEMIAADIGEKTGRRMGHVSISGEQGVLARLAPLKAKRKLLIHLNNSNPATIEGTPQRNELESRGFQVAHDGLAFEL